MSIPTPYRYLGTSPKRSRSKLRHRRALGAPNPTRHIAFIPLQTNPLFNNLTFLTTFSDILWARRVEKRRAGPTRGRLNHSDNSLRFFAPPHLLFNFLQKCNMSMRSSYSLSYSLDGRLFKISPTLVCRGLKGPLCVARKRCSAGPFFSLVWKVRCQFLPSPSQPKI